jgi:hypothetical protein
MGAFAITGGRGIIGAFAESWSAYLPDGAVLYARKSTIDKAAWAGRESQLELGREYAGEFDRSRG